MSEESNQPEQEEIPKAILPACQLEKILWAALVKTTEKFQVTDPNVRGALYSLLHRVDNQPPQSQG